MISGEEHTAQRDTPMARLQRERDRRTALAHDETISDNVKDSIKNLITHLGKSYRALYGMEIHDVIIRPNPAGTIVTCIVDVPGESTITLPEEGSQPRRQSPPIPKGFSRIPVEGRSQLPHPSQRYSRADVLSRCGAAVRPRIYF